MTMAQLRWVPVVSALSAGVGLGCYIGMNLDQSKKTEDVDVRHHHHYQLSLPAVYASSSLSLPQSAQSQAVTTNVSPISKSLRSSQIMTYGFPSLDNLRICDDYVLAYDKRNRTALWVFEHLTADRMKKNDAVDRNKSIFTEDENIHPYFRATNADYKGSGYDRGHLAAARNHSWTQSAMDQTFSLSNISPQVGKGFNRDAWNTLEKFVRHLTKKYQNVYVCTGPLYLPRRESDGRTYVKYEVIGKNNVAVPTHFFKVIVMETPAGDKELLSFVMPNQALPDNIDLKSYLVPTDVIERASGFLLFDKIPKKSFTKINGNKV